MAAPRAAHVLRALTLAASALVAASGCEIREDESPVITIVEPDDGALNDSSSVRVVVDVDRFTLDPTVLPIDDDGNGKAFHGHWHLYLDRFFVDDQFTTEALLTGIEPGVHEIAAELVNQNHTYIHGTPVAFAYIEVPEDAPSVEIQEPDDGDPVASSSVDVTVSTNLVLDSSFGGVNVEGRGHYHVYLDGASSTALESASPTFTVTDLSLSADFDEEHLLVVEMVNNDHTPFAAPVFDVARFEIPAGSPQLSIVSPAPNATVGTALEMELALERFELFDYTQAVADTNGKGHYHILVDGLESPIVHDWQPTPPAVILTPGEHEIRVELRSNLHDPLPSPVVDTVRVVVE